MQWLSAPKLAEMLKNVVPPLNDPPEEELPTQTPVLPWTLTSPGDGNGDTQRELQRRMMDLHKHPEMFQRDTADACLVDLSGPLGNTAGDVLQVDAGLRQLRFRIVPRYVSEERFWGRYFAACAAIRADVLNFDAAAVSPAAAASTVVTSVGAVAQTAQRDVAPPSSAGVAARETASDEIDAVSSVATLDSCATASTASLNTDDGGSPREDMPRSPSQPSGAPLAAQAGTAGPAAETSVSGPSGYVAGAVPSAEGAHARGDARRGGGAASPQALWPDMRGSRGYGSGHSPAAATIESASPAAKPSQRRVVTNPRRFFFSLAGASRVGGSVHSRNSSGSGGGVGGVAVDSAPRQPYLDGSLLADLREGAAPHQPVFNACTAGQRVLGIWGIRIFG